MTELTTGLRIGELLALQWDDINFRTGAVSVSKQATMAKGKMQITTPKTQSSIRTVYLSKPVLEALKEYRKTVDSQWVFPSQRRDELPLHPSAVRKRLHATLERAGCKDVRFHDLRHPYVKHTTKKYSCKSRNPKPSNILRWSGIPAFSIAEGADSQSNRSWTLYAISMRLPGNT